MISREQVRMARAALQWGVRDLADKAGVTANTISRFENGADAMGDTLDRIEKAIRSAGVDLIPENGGGAGVRLAKRKAVQVSPKTKTAKAKAGKR